MTNSSKHFASITSFISHTTSLEQLRFPEQQITLYCRQNDCSYEKISNIYQSYYERFKWNYDNFNEIVLLLSIALKKIDLKSNKENNREQSQSILKKSLTFLADIITSKMILVCLTSKNKQNSIYQHFSYAKGFFTLLVPQILTFDLHSELLELLENCNKPDRPKNFVGMNFIMEFMLISTTGDFLSEESEKKFKNTVINLLENEKQLIVSLLWNTQKFTQRIIEFKEIAYPRRDIECSKINFLEINNQGKVIANDKNSFQPESWIVEAYQRKLDSSIWRNIKVKNVIEIYQFLFKLQVFASSPLIQDLDLLIPNNDEFIEVFSKVLMGQDLIKAEQKNNQTNSTSIIKNIFQIKKLYDNANKTQKNILKKQLSKIFSENSSEEDQQNGSTQTEIDQ